MKTRKIIASALAFIMATTAVAASSVYAAGETVKVTASKTEAVAGGDFSVDISLSDIPATAIKGCEFAIKYDASVLSISDVKAGAITNTGVDSAESDISSELTAFYEDHSTAGTINLSWSTGLNDKGYWISKDGVFATISGTVDAGAKDGEYPIEIVPISRDDLEGTNSSVYFGYIENGKSVEYSASLTNGAVIIGNAETTTTTTTGIIGDVKYGDTNIDGSVSMVDLVYLNKYLANVIMFNDQQIANADCAKDDKNEVNPSDSNALMNRLSEQIDELPVIIG